MTLNANECNLGLSAHDALWDLRHEELVGARPADAALFTRLARYLVEQRHYAPVFPPTDRSKLPKTGTEEGTPVGASLDTSFLKLGEMVKTRPDVMVVPSALPPFVRVSFFLFLFLFLSLFFPINHHHSLPLPIFELINWLVDVLRLTDESLRCDVCRLWRAS